MNKQEQSALKEEYKEELRKMYKRDTNGMIDWYLGNAQRVVKLSDGSLYIIEKQKIKTSFCYGYGWNGISEDEDEERAGAFANAARSDDRYFIQKNMEGFSPFDRELPSWKSWELYYGPMYGESDKIIGISFFDYGDIQDKDRYYRGQAKRLSAEDEATLRKAYEEEKAVHLKKIQSYLKRYGLSKVRSWTYLVD